MKLETIKVIDNLLREAVNKAFREVESKKRETENALMAASKIRNEEEARREWMHSKELEQEQHEAKEWYNEVWKAQRDFANNDWR